METFLFNLEYMSFNLFLALIPVFFGYLMLKAKNKSLKLLYGFIWFIFLPNTAYILVDIVHLFEQLTKVDLVFKIVLLIQYGLFLLAGALTFIYATYFFERLIGKNKSRPAILLILNLIVGFGVILGFVQRTNSWYIFTQPLRVIEDTLALLYSPNLVVASFAFGLLVNIIYFYFSKPVIGFGKSIK